MEPSVGLGDTHDAGHHSSAQAVAVTPDGKLAVSGSADKTARIWSLVTGRLVRILQGHTETVWSVAVSPDGRQVASASGFIYGDVRDATVRLWDLATGAAIRVFEGHASAVNSVAFSADGGRLLSASADGTLREWHCATGEELRSVRAFHRSRRHDHPCRRGPAWLGRPSLARVI